MEGIAPEGYTVQSCLKMSMQNNESTRYLPKLPLTSCCDQRETTEKRKMSTDLLFTQINTESCKECQIRCKGDIVRTK